MKRAFISILLFFLIAHFIIPGIYYLYNGYFSIYDAGFDDRTAITKSYLLNGISLLLTCLIIYLIPSKSDKILPTIYNITPLFYFSLLFSIFFFFVSGGYEGIISGNMAGSLLTYITLFLSPTTILKILLFYQKRRYNVGLLLLISIAFITLSGSRSAIISIFLMILIYPAFTNYSIYKKKLFRYFYMFMIASPFMFVLASQLRGMDIDLLNNKLILNAIFGRLSMVEIGAIPIYYKDTGAFNSALFYEKYGILHQLGLIIDGLVPGNIFTFDVMPNQYYRAVFLNYSEDFVQDIYMSMNTTLPVYFYMYTGFGGAIFLTVAVLTGYYLLWKRYSNNIIISIALISQLYAFLYCFDFVMWFSQVLITVLSILTVHIYVFLRKDAVKYFKRHEEKII